MPRFSANISMMFKEYDFLERFQAAKSSGFGAIEIQFPYNFLTEELLESKEVSGVEISVMNIDAGDLISGGPGISAMPGRIDQFKKAVDQACLYAEVLRPLNMNVLSGWPPLDRFGREECLEVLVANLRYAAEALASTGTRVLIEACNTYERPGYLISTSAQAIEVISAADHENLALQYDLYHMQIMEGNLVNRMTEILDSIGHIQFADTPGRNEPGTGEINYPYVFAALDRMGWNGWLGAEYIPLSPTTETLEWLQPYV
jgi:hydroxypyruvate isomerase